MARHLFGNPGRSSEHLVSPSSDPMVGFKIDEGIIVVQRHLHMILEDAEVFKVKDGVLVEVAAGESAPWPTIK